MRLAVTAASLVVLCVAVACGDDALQSAPSSPVAPPGQPATLTTRLRGTVDVKTGTLSFEPLPASAGPALSAGAPNAAIYGVQGSTVRIYNSTVVASAPVAGKRTYSANVGLRNLLTYRIGDEQGVTAPADTIGIYVFMNTGPVVSGTSSPCPGCAVTVKNRQGTLNFTAANQAYWFWPEILSAANGGSDTTRVRQPWVFEADTAVTRFNFDVLVSAAWVSPHETVWKVDYPGDSLPDTQAEPRWHVFMSQGGPADSISNGNLMLMLKKTKDTLVFIRHDSVSNTTSAMIEGRLRLDDGGNSAAPQPGLAIDDNNRYIGLFVSDSSPTGRAQVGFVNATGLGFAGAADTVGGVKNFRIYQLRKYGADSAVILVDGVRRVKSAYNVLPLTKNVVSGPSYVEFGFTGGTIRTTTSTWDYVTYQIGSATP
jgi:hypothetical protein